jgi:addiction module HigA family antidote
MRNKKIPPLHPGEVLLEEFLKPMNISQNRLALDLGVPPRRINEIVLGKRGISADTALRLARYFNMPAQFWLGLQMDDDLDVEEVDRQSGLIEKYACMQRLLGMSLRNAWGRFLLQKHISQHRVPVGFGVTLR